MFAFKIEILVPSFPHSTWRRRQVQAHKLCEIFRPWIRIMSKKNTMFFLGIVISYRKRDPLLYMKPGRLLFLDSVNDSNASLWAQCRELKVILVNSWHSKFSWSWGYKKETQNLIRSFPLESPKDQVLMTWSSNPKHIRAVCNQNTKPQQLYNSSIGSNGEVLLPHWASRLHSSIISSYSSHDAPCGMQYNIE